jgi:hypothetical protein
MTLSVVFIIVDLLSVTPVIPIGVINPFWKFAFVFKCFTDSIILDDFKAALDKLSRHRMAQILPLNVFGDEPSHRDSGISARSDRRWPGSSSHGGRRDSGAMGELDRILKMSGAEISDAGGLCPPSPAVVHHVEHKESRQE